MKYLFSFVFTLALMAFAATDSNAQIKAGNVGVQGDGEGVTVSIQTKLSQVSIGGDIIAVSKGTMTFTQTQATKFQDMCAKSRNGIAISSKGGDIGVLKYAGSDTDAPGFVVQMDR